MTPGKRVRTVRQELDLTLEEFGDRIGIGRSSVSKIEREIVGLTDSLAISICREFGVSHEYLSTGKGDIFISEHESALDQLRRVYDLDDFDLSFLKAYLRLSPDDRSVLKEFTERFISLPDFE